MPDKITYDDFKKVEMRVAKVLEASPVEGSEKLLKLIIDAGDKDEAGAAISRQIVSGIAKYYTPEEMVGKQIVVVANLEPRSLMGLESNGMIIAAHGEDGSAVIVEPDKDVPAGSSLS
ncbi:MAG: methionine--tRNA ligase subunit beta [bacterium]